MEAMLTRTVGELVAERPGRARVFERFGIDYCCGGKRPLGEACASKKVEARAVVAALEAEGVERAPALDAAAMTATELANHIEGTHHAYLKAELPRLGAITRKVAGVHGARHPEWVELAGEFERFAGEMFAHMVKEERVLFPWVRGLERGEGPREGRVEGPISVMEQEHEDAGRSLERMEALTNGFIPPGDACATVRAMMDGLKILVADTHEHVHKENNVLFPRAERMQAEGLALQNKR